MVAILYGRTAIAELIAWGALAAGIGAYAALRVAPDPQRRHRVVLFTASAIFFGGHPLTLVFASALIATVLVAAAIGGARPTRRDRGPAALVLAGAAITLWQWPLSIFHLTLTSAPDTQVSLSTGAFLAPTGTGSEPRLVEVLDPRRIGLDGNGTWGISNEISLLLLALLVALLLHRLWNSSRLRPLVTPGALLGITLAIVVVPHSLRLTRLIPMVGAMQYYWRFFPYAVGALAAALVLVVRLIPDHQRRFVVFALAAAGILELTFGQVQAWRPIHPEMGTTISAAATVADLNPNPIYRNGGRAERDLDLPILEKVDAVPTPAVTPADAEAPLVVEVPGPSRVAVPSAVAPPFVRLAPTDRAVGWYVASRAAATGFESDQLWLVVDHRSAEQQLSVQTSGTPTVTFARVGGAVALPTFAAVVVLLLLPRRRPRRSASGYDPQHEGSDGASDNPHRRDVRGVPGQ